MRVFVTGADGFIGSHLCEALRDNGDEVTGLALYNSFDSFGWLDEVDGVTKVRGDVRDAAQMRELITGHDLVFHLAALVSVPHSYIAPQSFIDTNVSGTLNVLEACRAADAKLVHTSTSEVYGSAQYTPMDECHFPNPQSPYAASKVAADALVRSFRLSYGLPAVALRPFNTYGPRQSERAAVATIIRQLMDWDCEVVELGNLKATRDMMYVTDTVAAFLAVSELDSGVYNAGTGVAYGIDAIAAQIRMILGVDKDIVTKVARMRPDESEVTDLMADADLLTAATGWEPTVAIDDGIRKTIDWWRERLPAREQRYIA